MTPAEFSALLDRIGWSRRELARKIGVHEDGPRNWTRPGYRIPDQVADYLRAVAAALDAVPPPETRKAPSGGSGPGWAWRFRRQRSRRPS